MTDRDKYLWHVNKAANWDHIAANHERNHFWRRAQECRDEAQKHRDKAAALKEPVA